MPKYTPITEVRAAGSSSMGELLASITRANKNKIALSQGEKCLTYAELDARVSRIANFLLAEGLQQQDRIAILANNCLDYLPVILGAARVGVITACQNWRLGPRELQHCVSLVEPKIIVTDQASGAVLDSIDMGDARKVELGNEFDALISSCSEENPGLDVDVESGLIILYTSGTTGLPKGALISHRAMIARAQCLAADVNHPEDDNFMAWAPMYHMVSTDQSLGMLLRGNRVHVVAGLDIDEMARLIEAYPMRILPILPGMVGAFVSELQRRGVKPQKMGCIGAMADLVPKAEIEQATVFFNAPYLNTFGATETGLGPASAGVIPVGKVPARIPKKQNPMFDVRLVDENDDEVPDGTPGEVSITGACLFSGYWNNDEANRHDFRGGRFHMGDVLRRDENGLLDYVDRVKYMIKSGGENIYPAEIENLLMTDDRVETAVIVKKPDAKWSEVPVAFIVRRDAAYSEADVKELCNLELSRYKHPREVYFVEDADLPRSTTGKIQRHLLEARLTVE